MRLEKLATPELAVAVVVEPLAKLPVVSVTLMASLLPVPVVTTLPYWSSTLTPTVKAVPAVTDAAGWVVMARVFSAPATMVKPLLVPEMAVPLTVPVAVMVGAPAAWSE